MEFDPVRCVAVFIKKIGAIAGNYFINLNVLAKNYFKQKYYE